MPVADLDPGTGGPNARSPDNLPALILLHAKNEPAPLTQLIHRAQHGGTAERSTTRMRPRSRHASGYGAGVDPSRDGGRHGQIVKAV